MILAGSEVRALLDAIPDKQMRAAAETLYGTGVRVAELCRLRYQDIDTARMVLRVRAGKGGDERLVMLPKGLIPRLDELRVPESTRQYLFGGAGGGECLSAPRVRHALRRAAARAGLQKRVTPMVLRHTFATHLLDSGADVSAIQLLLGHREVASTIRYLRLTRRHVSALRSPLDLLGTAEGEILG